MEIHNYKISPTKKKCFLQAWAPLWSLAGTTGGRDVPGVRTWLLLARHLHPVCLPNLDLHHSTKVRGKMQLYFLLISDAIRLPYSQDQCGDFLSTQRLTPQDLEDPDDDYREGVDTPDTIDQQIYLVPEHYEQDQGDFQPPQYIYNQDDIEDEDYMSEEDQQRAWLHFQSVSTSCNSRR